MRKNDKSFLRAFIILIVVLVLATSFLNTLEPELGQPEDFYATSRKVSLNELVDVADQSNLLIYLPFEIPKNYELTVIYLKETPFIAIVVYSADGNKDYKTAELTIQISPSESTPTYDELVSNAANSEYVVALEINGWSALVNEKANVGSNIETRKKFGDFVLLVTVWINGIRYMICCPTLTTSSSILLVENMCLLT